MNLAVLGMEAGNIIIQTVSRTIYAKKIFVTKRVSIKLKIPPIHNAAKLPTTGTFMESCIL